MCVYVLHIYIHMYMINQKMGITAYCFNSIQTFNVLGRDDELMQFSKNAGTSKINVTIDNCTYHH